MHRILLLTLAVTSSCSRCGGAGPADAAAQVHRSTDLRTGFMTIYPEYRGTRVVGASVSLTRTYVAAIPKLAEQLKAPLEAKGFSVTATDLGFTATRAEFTLTGTLTALTLGLQIKDEDVGRAMMAPASLSSEAMSQLFPVVPGATIAHEDFELTLTWEAAKLERPWFLIRQMIGGAVTAGWRPTQPLPFGVGRKAARRRSRSGA